MKMRNFFLLLAALLFFTRSAAVSPVFVEEDYVITEGDTIWGIAERFMAKNTGTVREIHEYEQGIFENNPWLLDRHGLIYPGEELVMTYWIEEKAAE